MCSISRHAINSFRAPPPSSLIRVRAQSVGESYAYLHVVVKDPAFTRPRVLYSAVHLSRYVRTIMTSRPLTLFLLVMGANKEEEGHQVGWPPSSSPSSKVATLPSLRCWPSRRADREKKGSLRLGPKEEEKKRVLWKGGKAILLQALFFPQIMPEEERLQIKVW